MAFPGGHMNEQAFKRTDRVSDLLRKIISEVFATRIPHHGFDQVTITEVKVTPDLRSAHVFYRLLDPSKRTEIMHSIQQKSKIIQREVGSQTKFRNTPRLTFEYDESLDYGNKIEQLLIKIKDDDAVPSDNEEE